MAEVGNAAATAELDGVVKAKEGVAVPRPTRRAEAFNLWRACMREGPDDRSECVSFEANRECKPRLFDETELLEAKHVELRAATAKIIV